MQVTVECGMNRSIMQNILNLCENTYCLTVTELNGCTEDTCFNVEWNPCQLSDSIITPILCNGGSGTIQVTSDTAAGTTSHSNNNLKSRINNTIKLN